MLGDAEFEFIRHVIGENAGIVLGPNKRQLVQGRLARRLRELGLPTYEAYCEHVRESGPEELVGLINALTTNVTAFFRENHHFEALASFMLPEALKRNAASRRLRIWSAGCSTGEEPYCLAMVASEAVPAALALGPEDPRDRHRQRRDRGGGAGRLPAGSLVAPCRRNVCGAIFQQGRGEHAGQRAWSRPELRSLITFRTLNLLHSWPMRGPFDVIFCRNVMIYFDQPTRERLVQPFRAACSRRAATCASATPSPSMAAARRSVWSARRSIARAGRRRMSAEPHRPCRARCRVSRPSGAIAIRRGS